MQGLIEEGQETIAEDALEQLADLGLIAAAQRGGSKGGALRDLGLRDDAHVRANSGKPGGCWFAF